MIRLYAGGFAILGIVTTSGLKLATLERESSGKNISLTPTFVVVVTLHLFGYKLQAQFSYIPSRLQH